MSRLWDTSEIYARTEADELLRDYPNSSVERLAESFERSHPTYEQDPEFAREIVSELRKRAKAGVRFWPDVTGLGQIEAEVRALIDSTASILSVAEPLGEEELAPGYWWQRM